mmetsp:Transcript_135373/g.201328  ORF Transcript_135373/g.201328 Transcript_135373/m.201328 type:complete len:316 (+) Transcript_135373:40-987(+)
MFTTVKPLGRIPRVISDENTIASASAFDEDDKRRLATAATMSSMNTPWSQPPSSLQPYTEISNKFGKKLVIKPGVNDVLCGRGGAANSHIGNMRFRNFLDKHRDQYHNSTKSDKTHIAIQLVLHIQTQVSPPGRFLMKVPKSEMPASMDGSGDECWYEIDVLRAAKKVAQRLREKKSSMPISSVAAVAMKKRTTIAKISTGSLQNTPGLCGKIRASSCCSDEAVVRLTAPQGLPRIDVCVSLPSATLIVDDTEEIGDEQDTRNSQSSNMISSWSCARAFSPTTDLPDFHSLFDTIMEPSFSLPTAADLANSAFNS